MIIVGNRTSTTVKTLETANGTYTYTYDAVGNILSINDGTYTVSYVYDGLNQLVRENDQRADTTTVFTYTNGNITGKKVYKYTLGNVGEEIKSSSYGYSNSEWRDLLTSFNGQAVTYDEIGNPITFGSKTFEWCGRQLERITDGDNTYVYSYNTDGDRVSKTVNGVKTEYFYNGSILAGQKTGDETLIFMYDNNGDAFGFIYNGEEYYYIKNVQNDIVAIADKNGTVVANYYYDAWGNVTRITGNTALAQTNPLRYRSYYYDSETGFYYVSSRYYDPEIGRFINADAAIGQIGNVQGTNMFAYCFNNPVNMSDPTGNWPKLSTIFTVVAVAAVAVAAVAVTVATCGAAAPALAVAGGGIIGGISAGAAATAASVATGAMIVAGVSSVAAVTSAVAEKTVEKTAKRNHSVYVLKDDTGTVQYVGRTTDVAKRAKAHEANPARAGLKLEVIQPNLNYVQARAVEQAAMAYYHTINTANKMNNQINGISPFNPKLGVYKEAAVGMLGYAWNQVSNEILYWTEY